MQNALIEDSYISVGDDAIAIKSGLNWFGRTFGRPSSNITFRRINVGTGHGISIGSEMSANVTNVLFEDIFCNGTETGPRVGNIAAGWCCGSVTSPMCAKIGP